MEASQITLQDFARAVLKYKDSRKTNPTDDHGRCLYTDKYRKRHCLIGQVLTDLGVPREYLVENRPARMLHIDWDPTTRNLADRMQATADVPRPRAGRSQWREVIAIYMNHLVTAAGIE